MNYKEKFIETVNKIAEKELYKVDILQEYVEVLHSQDDEIERLNNLLKETGQILSEETIKSITLKSENERLNNIINELEKWLVERIDEYKEMGLYDNADMYEYTLYTLQELKGR